MPSERNTGLRSSDERSTGDDAVLDAAREAILAVGWRRTTLTDVARRAGLSRMTLYRRWPDMQALLADLMTREWGSTLLTVTDRHRGETALAQVRAAVVEVAEMVRGDALFQKIVQVDPELLLPYLLDRRGRSQQLVLDATVQLLREGQRLGTVRDGDPELLARSLLLLAQGFVVSAQTMTDDAVSEPGLAAELGELVERYLVP
jgi:AcrR family transcriptional regulator